MKVLYFTRTQTPHDLRFTLALSHSEHQVFVLCLEPKPGRDWPNGVTEIQWQGMDVKNGWQIEPSQVERLHKVLGEVKPDLVHAGPIQTAAYAAALSGFHPLVSMSWGSDLLENAEHDEYWHRVTRFALENTDVLVGDCASVGHKAASLGFDLSRYKQFPWGVNLLHFSPSGSANLRKELGWQERIVFLSNRTLEPLYGVEVLVKAFAAAAGVNPDLRLMLYGKGSQEDILRNMVQELGIKEKVYFGGVANFEHLPDLYCSADFYLSASHSDGSSVSLMEALACGLPVIVSDIPGNLEWIREGEQGWLFKDGDAVEASQKMLLAASQLQQFETMKKENRALAERRADWTKNFNVLLEAYQLAAKKVAFND